MPYTTHMDALQRTCTGEAMQNNEHWDWAPGTKSIANLGEWLSAFEAVEEPYVSPDGEKIAAIVKVDEGSYSVCVNSVPWESPFDKIWSLRFSPENLPVAIVSADAMWTVAIEGIPWENQFEFVWDLQFARSGSSISVAAQNSRSYFAVSDDIPWEGGFDSLNHLTTGPDGKTVAAVVQTVPIRDADILSFQKGCFTVAVNGTAWDRNFVNAWEIDISRDSRVAAEIRQTLYDYTIAVDGVAWPKRFASVWRPRFNPADHTVTAPVKLPDGWTLALDGAVLWGGRYVQLWHHLYSPDGKRIAAICAPGFGKWTMVEDSKPWPITFNEAVTDPVYSPDGRHLACLGKSEGKWYLAVDGDIWPRSFDRIWPPVFSPDGHHVAAKVKIGENYAIAIDGKPLAQSFTAAWDPVFSPDGRKLLVKGIGTGANQGQYSRNVVETAASYRK